MEAEEFFKERLNLEEKIKVKINGVEYRLYELEEILNLISEPFSTSEEYEKRKREMLEEIEKNIKNDETLLKHFEIVKKINSKNLINELYKTVKGVSSRERFNDIMSKIIQLLEKENIEEWRRAYFLYKDTYTEVPLELEERFKEIKDKKMRKEFIKLYEINNKEFANTFGEKLLNEAFQAIKENDIKKFRFIKRVYELALILVEADKNRDEEVIKLFKKDGATMVIEKFGRKKTIHVY
jgi:hypothetical protein